MTTNPNIYISESRKTDEGGSHKPDQYASAYKIPPRRLVAVEHPMIIKDVDKGIRTFGENPDYKSVSENLISAGPPRSWRRQN
jgi:hypothetical protein